MRVMIGTSGFSYKDWRNKFYPPGTKPGNYLQYYSSHFSTVEINTSFYNFPQLSTLKKWREITSQDFCFSMKGSRFITHIRKLRNSKELVTSFLKLIATLSPKLGPILFQLPPQMEADLSVLENFLSLLSQEFRYVFEFRHTSWYKTELYDLLNKYKCVLCIHDHIDAASPPIITSDFIYIRMHGPDGKYLKKYGDAALLNTANFINKIKEKHEVYCYFNNDTNAYAIENAKFLIENININS